MNYNSSTQGRRLQRQNSINMNVVPTANHLFPATGQQQQTTVSYIPMITHGNNVTQGAVTAPTLLPQTHVLQHQLSNSSNTSSSSSQCSVSNNMLQIATNVNNYLPQPSQQYATQLTNQLQLQQQQQQQLLLLQQQQQQTQQTTVMPQLHALLPNILAQQQQQQPQLAQSQSHSQAQQLFQQQHVQLPQQPATQTQQLHHQQPQQQQQQQAQQFVVDDTPATLMPEICDIMRSFGDSDRPRMDSVRLVEQILQQQLRSMFNEASMVALRRKNNACPSQADFEFLMRNKPVKIARMRKHLKDMRILKKFLSIRTGRPQDFAEELERHESDEELSLEVPELFDEERTRRLFRADRISQILSGQQYVDFNEARKTSFYCRHGEKIKNKFRSFLQLPTDLRIPVTVMNILAYFAHETIAVIVDYAILTRLNTSNRKTEPYSRVTSAGASAAMLHICPEVTQGRGMEVLKPITVQEIHEGLRRFRQMTTKRIGFGRGNCDYDARRSFLAL